jgi:16S rRNA (cytidine1402-2'-O)-methyltransferase
VAGRVLLVGTPIGNLGDLSSRALEALESADVIACEDTRVTRKLLTHAGVSGKRLVALHAHNEATMAARVVDMAGAGATVAVVSDAGLPGISDPGEWVVRAAVDAGVPVELVPGPSAAVTALVVSGLPADRFCFEGFLPRKGRERAARLAAIASEPRTVVLFESPRRVAETVADLAAACGGERPVAVARELTKIHEEVWRGTLSGAASWLGGTSPRGEYVVVVGGAPPAPPASTEDVEAAVAARIDAGVDSRTAVAEVAASLGVPRRDAYAAAVRLRPPRVNEGT